MKKIALLSHVIDKNLRKSNDGEILYLGKFLYDNGYEVQVLENYCDFLFETRNFCLGYKPDVVIINICRTEFLNNTSIYRFFKEIDLIKDKYNADTILIGSIANCLASTILEQNKSVGAIIGFKSISYNSSFDSLLFEKIQSYYSNFPKLSESYLILIGNKLQKRTISLNSSRGCSNNCSFCSYNEGYKQEWSERNIKDFVADIKICNKVYGVNKFALFDNNFASSKDNNLERTLELSKEVSSLEFEISLTLNFNLNNANEKMLYNLKKSSVTAFLVGIESFSSQTLSKFSKSIDIGRYKYLIDYAEKIGLIPIVSYILFHPWISFEQLLSEIREIEEFGRYRIPQYMANSKLVIVPNTKIEKQLEEEKLIQKNGFCNKFIFKDKRVEKVYKELKKFYNRNIVKDRSIKNIPRLKINEWDYLVELTKKY